MPTEISVLKNQINIMENWNQIVLEKVLGDKSVKSWRRNGYYGKKTLYFPKEGENRHNDRRY